MLQNIENVIDPQVSSLDSLFRPAKKDKQKQKILLHKNLNVWPLCLQMTEMMNQWSKKGD